VDELLSKKISYYREDISRVGIKETVCHKIKRKKQMCYYFASVLLCMVGFVVLFALGIFCISTPNCSTASGFLITSATTLLSCGIFCCWYNYNKWRSEDASGLFSNTIYYESGLACEDYTGCC